MSKDFDVIVIGAGGAGLAAASIAASAGKSVLLAEARDQAGGATGMSHGVFYAAGTKPQAEAGIQDSPDAMYKYAMALNQYRMRPSLLRRYCYEGAQAMHWLMSLGVEFPANEIYHSGLYSEMSGTARCHSPVGYGAAITQALEASLDRSKVDLAFRTRVEKLFTEGGRVSGVIVGGEIVSADAVVITSGGFGANRELINAHYPSAARHASDTWYIGLESSRGDGISMGADVDADLIGHDGGLLLPTPNLQHHVLENLPAWLMIVNRDGYRFMDEAVGYGVQSGLVDAQPGSECFAIVDSETFQKPPTDPRFARIIADGMITTQWTHDGFKAGMASGRVVKGETLQELGGKLGVRPGALQASVELHNADTAAGVDSLFFKKSDYLHPVRSGPYYGVRMVSGILCFTSTGLRIDKNARVLSRAGVPIPGLYAAGEAAGGVLGERYLGSGSAVANAIIFGRIAGQSAIGAN